MGMSDERGGGGEESEAQLGAREGMGMYVLGLEFQVYIHFVRKSLEIEKYFEYLLSDFKLIKLLAGIVK